LTASLGGQSGPVPKTQRKSCSRLGVLLDRDGTIIIEHGSVGSVDRVEFVEGRPEAIAKFNRASIPVAVVTNQAGVARCLDRIDDVIRVNEDIAKCLAEHGAHIDLDIGPAEAAGASAICLGNDGRVRPSVYWDPERSGGTAPVGSALPNIIADVGPGSAPTARTQ
jgi:hypothetical protein